jgi:tRNA(adenine34) deaminase
MRHDKDFMRAAMEEAEQAAQLGEIPVGAVVVHRGKIIARGFNRRETWHDPSAHAEVMAIRRAAEHLGSWRLEQCSLFVTLEPCVMCAGAILSARLPRLVYGARDAKAGAVRSLFALLEDPRLNHRVQVSSVLQDECAESLSSFFAALRAEEPGNP